MSLSPTMKLFGTAINYGFGDVEETGILIAVDEILAEKRVRHIQSFIESKPEACRLTSGRSEEHTSELQSRQYLVCRLLLEKKKKTQHNITSIESYAHV